MLAWLQRWRDMRKKKFGWLIWWWFGWWSLFAFVVCAWLAVNYSDHKKTGLSLLFGVAACILGVLSLGCFLGWAVGLIRAAIEVLCNGHGEEFLGGSFREANRGCKPVLYFSGNRVTQALSVIRKYSAYHRISICG